MVEGVGAGRFLIQREGESRLAYAIVDGDRTWVFIEGRTYVVAARHSNPQRGRPRNDDLLALSAPMPATVLAVNTAAGRDVREGDVLITLEAMKMELPIPAPHAGRVKAVHCREGELVQPGVPLLELE